MSVAGIFNRRVGVLATIVTLSFPHILSLAFSAEAEIAYTAFLMAALAYNQLDTCCGRGLGGRLYQANCWPDSRLRIFRQSE